MKQYPDAEQLDGIVIVRLDAPLYFANSRFIRDRLRRYKRKAEARASFPPRSPLQSRGQAPERRLCTFSSMRLWQHRGVSLCRGVLDSWTHPYALEACSTSLIGLAPSLRLP